MLAKLLQFLYPLLEENTFYEYSDMWTHSNWVGVTYISRLSPTWKFQFHFTCITDVSPAFSNCQVKKYPPLKKKTTPKSKNKALFKEKRAPGKTPLYQGSLEHLTTLCMTSVYFHFFLCLSIISSLCIVYNRGARLVCTCLDTPSWWWHLANKNVTCSIYARVGRKMKSTCVWVQPFFSKNPKQQSNRLIISERLI